MKYFDIHSHLNFPQYDEDRAEVLARMDEHDVCTITVGTNSRTSKEAVDLAHDHNRLYACIGLHPVDEDERAFEREAFEEMLGDRVVAVGETGLDYNHGDANDAEEVKRQKDAFEAQIQFGLDHNLPLMIHCRDAYDDTLEILESYKKEHGDKLGANMHFFAGSIEEAKRVLELGFMVSFTGVVTFAEQYKELVQYVPLERMMAETDAPFVAPAPDRGKRNEPAFVRYTYDAIADIRGEDCEMVRQVLTANAQRFFGI